MNREAIYTALFTKLQGAYAWKDSGRILRHWADVSPAEQPAMYMTQISEQATTTTRQKTRWLMSVKVYVYAYGQTEAGVPPATLINPLLDAITEAMKPDNVVVEVQNLGGLVEYARIEGGIETDEGFLGEQAVAIIPINIYTAD